MKHSFRTLVLAGITLASAGAANANETAVPMSGTVTSTCVVALGGAGTLAANAANTVLDSENGGASGSATITTTGANFQLTTVAPTDWTVKAPTYTGSTTFASKYTTSGATAGGGAAGAALALVPGTTTANVDLKATADSGVFHAGNYTAVVTVRCEAVGAGAGS